MMTPPAHPDAFEDVSYKDGLAPLRAPAFASLRDARLGCLPSLRRCFRPYQPFRPIDDAPAFCVAWVCLTYRVLTYRMAIA